jgi:hypothetical protein
MTKGQRDPDDEDFERLASSVGKLVEGLEALRAQARALGIFTNDRELLTCPRCGLMENVLFDGRLITCREEDLEQDTGLRFTETAEESGRFTCPACGAEVEPDEGEP